MEDTEGEGQAGSNGNWSWAKEAKVAKVAKDEKKGKFQAHETSSSSFSTTKLVHVDNGSSMSRLDVRRRRVRITI